ncbi:hypothetical protein ABKY47_002025 [Aeromonas hydrophila]
MNKEIRISEIQALTLRLLLLFANKGQSGPIPSVVLLSAVEKNRVKTTYANNFRKSCHILVENGFIHLHRNRKSLKMAYTLTPLGLVTAGELEVEAQERERKEEEAKNAQ